MARKRAHIAPRVGRITMAIAVGATALLLTNGAAIADVGVGIGAAPITLADPADPGGSYPIGPVTIVNTGDEAATVGVRVGDDPAEAAQPVPAEWIKFDESTLELDAGEEAFVGMQLNVPDDAKPGDYQSLVYAGLTPAHHDHGDLEGSFTPQVPMIMEIVVWTLTNPRALAGCCVAAPRTRPRDRLRARRR